MAPAVPTALRTGRLAGAARRTVDRARRLVGARPGPFVTVVVTATAAQAPFLDECLDSVRGQSHTSLEVLVVPVGPVTPALRATARRHAGEDWRLRLVDGALTLAGARDRGADLAKGERLLLVQAAHTLPGEALTRLLGPGGDTPTVGRVTRPDAGPEAGWLTGLQTDDSWAVAGVGVDGVLFHTKAWEAAGPAIGTDPVVVHEVAVPGVRLVRATVCTAHARGDGLAFGHMASRLGDLPAWLDGVAATARTLTGETYDRWLVGLLLRDLPLFVDDAERMDAATWTSFVRTWRDLLDDRWDDVRRLLPVHLRLLAWLLQQGDQQRFTDVVVGQWFERGLPTEVRDGHVYAVRPDVPDAPADVLRLTERETALRVSLRRVRATGDRLLLDLFAYPRYVDLAGVTPTTTVTLADSDGRRVPADVTSYVDGTANRLAAQAEQDVATSGVTVSVDPLALEHGTWRVEVETEARGVVRAGRVDHRDRQGSAGPLVVQRFGVVEVQPRHGDDTGLTLEVRPSDGRAPASPSDGFLVDDVAVGADTLTLRGHWRGPERDVTLRVAEVAVRGRPLEGGLAFALTASRWGGPAMPLPSGTARFDVPGGRVVPSPGLLGTLPRESVEGPHRMRWMRTGSGHLGLVLAAPLRDDELGASAQWGLRASYTSVVEGADPRWVYLQSYTGETATDSPRAIHDELVRQGRDLVLHWGVADLSVPVPSGGRPVLLRSREWYDVLARSGALVSNINFDRWFEKRPGQRVLQTFHGYPAKAMGRGLWASKEFTPRRVEIELARSRADWDTILTPVPEMDEHYRREYAYDGQILSVGYPRDDALLSAEADDVRARTRALLGLRDDQTAVLYAPTWRDDLATNFRKARSADTLDVDAATKALGDDVVWLLRGHRFHAPPDRATSARVRDVGGYPEINDLVLASDVAVLDYSSLRFDYALTGRPMLFLVPDLETYTGGTRGFLFDFRDSAPGPLLASTAEVADAVRLVRSGEHPWSKEVAAFNATYNHTEDGRAAQRVVDAFFGPA